MPRIESRDHARWFERPILAPIVLGVLLFLVAQLGDPGAYLTTDVGGKVATIEVIVEHGPTAPDLGYWAEEYDPDGSLYPMWSTLNIDGAWVNATSLPMLYMAAPLYALGGFRLALLVPVLGTVLAALAARRLAEQLGGDPVHASLAFWTVGVASPATVYALDLWEHSFGLGLMAWATVAVVACVDPERVRTLIPFLAGLAFAGAASMRQEALVYGFVAGFALVLTLLLGSQVRLAVTRGTAMLVGTGGGLVANMGLEWLVFGSPMRAGRGTGTAGAAGSAASDRVQEAVITGFSPMASFKPITYVLAAALVCALAVLAWRADEEEERTRVIRLSLLAIGLFVATDLAVDGLRFIPGLAATTPVAVFGVVRGWTRGPRRLVVSIAVGALPLVWLTQYTGGATPQWGGRYLLLSGFLLLVAGIVSCDTPRARSTLRLVIAAGVVVSCVGVVWTVKRTHAFADLNATLADRPEQALVFEDAFLPREAGPRVLEERWLAASTPEARAEAVVVLRAAGIDEVGMVEYANGRPRRELPGWSPVSVTEVPLLNGLFVTVTTWVDSG